jgi:hypothetical protein
MSVMVMDIYFLVKEKNIMLKNATVILNKVRRVQELRRSNAATAIPSKKKYSRKQKHKKLMDERDI